jgi:anti-sigma-K factor RskA
MKLTNPDLQSRLAAEYVLGTMHGGARRRFEEYMAANRNLRDVVQQWERYLTPLAESVAPVAPPDRVWKKIEARAFKTKNEIQANTATSSQNAPKTPAKSGLFASLAFWRNVSLGATALAAALLIVTTLGVTQPKEPMMMAVLEDQGVARMVIEQPKSGILMVKMVKPWKAEPDKSIELWVISKDGKPQSFGLVNETGETKFITNKVDVMLEGGLVLALSKEPKGGSPTGLPTGMTLCKGAIAKIPSKKAKAQI